ncbi:hypothetical protein [Actinoplanes sp. NBRC 103695]|uniref:hypothetical protein n=1 Tax=Actinoplanes sp. NBRC 103695 TaxID=3032202 RepID=UPI002555F1D8|nr:hypothetical protein [Actinoplanes sp. NBRC 103695]
MTGGLVCGGITAATIGGVLAALDDYQVRDFSDMDPVIGVAGGAFAATIAAMLILIVHRRPSAHAVVPLLLVPPVLTSLTTGLERDRLEAAVLWGAVAMAVQLLVATRWWRRAVPAILLVCLAGAGATWAVQEHWRAHAFEALGVPLYVPDAPGYRLTGAHPGRYSLIVRLEGAAGGFDAVVERAWPSCPERDRAQICLPDGYAMTLHPAQGQVRVRKADGSELARLPGSVTLTEAD